MNSKASEIIDAMGGTNAVAAELDVVKSAVSNWRRLGIPKHAYMLLMKKKRLKDIIDPHIAKSKSKPRKRL